MGTDSVISQITRPWVRLAYVTRLCSPELVLHICLFQHRCSQDAEVPTPTAWVCVRLEGMLPSSHSPCVPVARASCSAGYHAYLARQILSFCVIWCTLPRERNREVYNLPKGTRWYLRDSTIKPDSPLFYALQCCPCLGKETLPERNKQESPLPKAVAHGEEILTHERLAASMKHRGGGAGVIWEEHYLEIRWKWEGMERAIRTFVTIPPSSPSLPAFPQPSLLPSLLLFLPLLPSPLLPPLPSPSGSIKESSLSLPHLLPPASPSHDPYCSTLAAAPGECSATFHSFCHLTSGNCTFP